MLRVRFGDLESGLEELAACDCDDGAAASERVMMCAGDEAGAEDVLCGADAAAVSATASVEGATAAVESECE